MADEPLATLLADAERAQLQLLGAIPDRPERVAQLKDAVLFLLDVLAQVEAPTDRREALAALRRVFSPCVAYLHDERAFLDDSSPVSSNNSSSSSGGLLMSPRQGVKRGNVVLKALLGAITALSTRSEFPEETVRGLVDLVRELCAQCIHAVDVAMLFDFLRLGRPPARRWLLQAQRYLVELPPTPRAIFAMQGEHAGIIAPSHVGLLTKKGYTCSFGVRLDPGAPPQMALYSFRGQSGHGVSALLDGNSLVVRSHVGLGAVQQVDVPFAEWRAQMEVSWVHVCVVHAKKMVFKDKVTVFVDGKPIYNGNLAYPDTLNAAGGQNSVGVMPAAPGIQGNLWSPTLFGLPLSEAEVQKLHWLTHWKSDISSVAAENVGLADKSKFMFSYDARNCDLDRRICHDGSGNEYHGWLEPGTRTYVTQNFVQALDAIGGCACFLLLLLDQVPEMADFHPKTEFGMDEIADLLAFVGSALQSSIECRAHFVRLQGAKVVEFVLQSISPSYLSVDLLDSVVRIIEALIGSVEKEYRVLSDLIHRLLFFNPNWFLSEFETQVKLIDEVLPRYLQLLQEQKARYLHLNNQNTSEPADLFAQNPSLFNNFDLLREVDVDFFCNLIVQVYLARESAEGEPVTTAQMDEYQLKHLRVLIIQNLIGRMLSPSPSLQLDTPMDQWEQLIAHICRRCGGEATGPAGCVEIEEILSYLTHVLNSDLSRAGAFSAPLTRQQLTGAICSVSKGTFRVLWRPMIVSVDSVRLAALRFFESYTSEKVLLRRRDILMLCSALQAHLFTSPTVDLLLSVVIGRKTVDTATSRKSGSPSFATRSAMMTRLEFIPMALLGLIHNAEPIDQLQILMEIKTLILSPAVSDSVREAIRSWPPWMSRLRAIALRATERHEQVTSSSGSKESQSMLATESDISAQALNELCMALSDDETPISIKLDALQTIAQSGDQRGCDFALSALHNTMKSGLFMRAVVNMVSENFPDRAELVVAKLSNQLIVDVVVYSIVNVRNGWMHMMELFFYYSKRPSDLCSLVAAISDRVLQRVELRQWPGGSIESVVWENLSQVAAVVSQCEAMATAVGVKLGIHEAALSSGQQVIFVRKAFDLWSCVAPHLDEIRWIDLAAHLVANADYGSEVTTAEKEIFTTLAANHSQAQDLMLQTAVKRLRLTDFSCNDTAWELIDAFSRMLAYMKLIPVSHLLKTPGSKSFSARVSSTIRSTAGVGTSSVPRGSFHGSLGFNGSGNNLPATMSSEGSDTAAALAARFGTHLSALNASFIALDKHLKVEMASVETAQLLIRVIIGLASNGLQHRDEESESNELTKTLQIMASTDAEFFREIPQIQELSALWHLHWDANFVDESSGCTSPVAASTSMFLSRWVAVTDQHSLEFNPYLIQKHAAIQAETLGNELYASEQLWKGILDRSAALSNARQLRDDAEEEPRLVELKQDVDKFASSIHKLLARSSTQNATLQMDHSEVDSPGSPNTILDVDHTTEESNGAALVDNGEIADSGPLFKVSSRENAFRMRLRLKEVSPNYRIRNLSCECAGSGFLDTDSKGSGKFIARRLLNSYEFSGGDLDKSWRSDADSDYSDFLADAQMRAAIIRSTSNVDTQGLPLADGFSDDDLDIADDDEEEREDEEIGIDECQGDISVEVVASPKGLTTTLDQFIAPSDSPSDSHQNSPSAVIADESTFAPASASTMSTPIPVPVPNVSSPPTSATPSMKSIASSPLSAYAFGASVLSAVGGMAGFVQKAAKDAKDVVEYSVDSLYTAKDAFSEEAQSIMQEVSTIMDNNAAQGSHDESTVDLVTHTAAGAVPGNVAFDQKSTQRELLMPPPHPPPAQAATPRSSMRSRRDIQFRAKLIRHMHVVEGRLLLSDSLFGFIADRVVDEHDAIIVERKGTAPIDKPWRFLFKNRRWRIDDISGLHRRRYLLKPTALEFFIQSTRKNYFFNFAADDVTAFHEALMHRRPMLLKRDPTVRRLRHPSSIFRNSNMTSRWVNHEISTFEYLMWLNTIAGRTYNDLTQYPVFPWVIADYDSTTLDLSRRTTYRDLSKPMGALEPSRLQFFLDRYHAFDDPDIPKFMYGTHYSNIGAVLYYLIRLEPFTSFALAVQGGKYDHADRLFHCVAETWRNCLTDFTDLKELTPEWFYLPEFLMNCNRLDLGIKQNGVSIGDVVLPPWAKSPEDFVLKNLLVLESDYVSANIHQWIDLVFGAKQRGPAAEAANNIFFYLTYEGMVDIDSITDPVLKSSMRAQIAHFGQTPTQVLRGPHPSRQLRAHRVEPAMLFGPGPEAPRELPEGSMSIQVDKVDMTQLVVPHDAPIVHITMTPGTSTLLCLDSNGMLSTHRYGSKPTKVHHHHQRDKSSHQHNHLTLNEISASATRATASVFKSGSTPVTSPTNSGSASADRTHLPSSDYLELQDRKSHRALGEKRLLEGSADSLRLSRWVAFVNSGSVLCSVGHHDFSARFHSAVDGSLLYRLLQHSAVVSCLGTNRQGSLLAFGSADGTLSVWKVAQSNSTILDTIKLFRRGARGGGTGVSSKASSLPSSPISTSKPVLGNDYAADQVLLGHRARVNCVAISEELSVCVSGSAANECLAHSLEDGAILRQFDVGAGVLAPGVTAVALSSVGHIVVQSLGSGVPVLHSFHLNGTLLARLELAQPVTFLDVCSRSSRVVTSDGNVARVMSALTLHDQQVLLHAKNISTTNGSAKETDRITAQALAPDEEHVIFGAGVGRVVCVLLPPPSPIDGN